MLPTAWRFRVLSLRRGSISSNLGAAEVTFVSRHILINRFQWWSLLRLPCISHWAGASLLSPSPQCSSFQSWGRGLLQVRPLPCAPPAFRFWWKTPVPTQGGTKGFKRLNKERVWCVWIFSVTILLDSYHDFLAVYIFSLTLFIFVAGIQVILNLAGLRKDLKVPVVCVI